MRKEGLFLRYHLWLLCIIVFFYYLLGVITITHFPIVSVDDGWQWNNALLWIKPDFVSINAPFFDTKIGVPYLMDFLLGQVGKFWGVGLFEGRILVLSISLVVLLFLYLLVRRIYGVHSAFWTIIFLISTDTFLSGSRLIRNEMLLGVFLLIWAYFFYAWLKTEKNIWLILASLALAFGFDVHQNSAIFFLSSLFILAFLIRKPLKEKLTSFTIYLTGPIFYSIYYLFAHVLPNKEAFWELNSYAVVVDHPMPIFSLDPIEIFLSELSRYVNHFWGPRIFESIIIFSGFLLIISRKKIDESFLGWFILFTTILFFPFSANKLPHYFVTFYIFYALFAGFVIWRIFLFSWQKIINLKVNIKTTTLRFSLNFPAQKESARLVFLLVLSFLILFLSFNIYRIGMRLKNFSSHDIYSLGEKVNQIIPPDSRVMGLPYWMLVLPDHQLVSSYTLTWYRVIEGKSLKETFAEISPNIFILDKHTKGYFVNDRGLIGERNFQKGLYSIYQPELLSILAEKGKLVAKIADNFFGPIEVYHLNFK